MVKQSSHLPRLNHEETENKIRPIMCKEVESVIKQQQQQQKPPNNNSNKKTEDQTAPLVNLNDKC